MTVKELIKLLSQIEEQDLPVVVCGKHFNNIEATNVDVGVEKFIIRDNGTVTELCVNIT